MTGNLQLASNVEAVSHCTANHLELGRATSSATMRTVYPLYPRPRSQINGLRAKLLPIPEWIDENNRSARFVLLPLPRGIQPLESPGTM